MNVTPLSTSVLFTGFVLPGAVLLLIGFVLMLVTVGRSMALGRSQWPELEWITRSNALLVAGCFVFNLVESFDPRQPAFNDLNTCVAIGVGALWAVQGIVLIRRSRLIYRAWKG